jgi:hypothetical protein
MFKSVDAGANWAPINSGLGNTAVFAVTIDPGASATLYASTGGGTSSGGVYKSHERRLDMVRTQ